MPMPDKNDFYSLLMLGFDNGAGKYLCLTRSFFEPAEQGTKSDPLVLVAVEYLGCDFRQLWLGFFSSAYAASSPKPLFRFCTIPL